MCARDGKEMINKKIWSTKKGESCFCKSITIKKIEMYL